MSRDNALSAWQADLWDAVSRGLSSRVAALLRQRPPQAPTLSNLVDRFGATPLHVASRDGHVRVARILLDNGADKDKAALDGATALFVASCHGHPGAVKLLLSVGADEDKANNNAMTPLYIASSSAHIEVVRLLLDRGADRNKATDNGSTPLFAAVREGRLDIVRLLLDSGADVDKATVDGETPLCVSVVTDRTEMAKLLLERGADVDKAAREKNCGATPLVEACRRGFEDMTRLLIAKGAAIEKTTNDGATPLYVACAGRERAPAVKKKATNGVASLRHVAGRTGFWDVSRLLLDEGADVDKATNDGSTPLYVACLQGHAAVVGVLLAYGARVEKFPPYPHDDGILPLRPSCGDAVARLLMICGADAEKAIVAGAPRRFIDDWHRRRSRRRERRAERTPCLYCGKYRPGHMKKCKRCRRRYCSPTCQHEHWSDHKRWCRAHWFVEDADDVV